MNSRVPFRKKNIVINVKMIDNEIQMDDKETKISTTPPLRNGILE